MSVESSTTNVPPVLPARCGAANATAASARVSSPAPASRVVLANHRLLFTTMPPRVACPAADVLRVSNRTRLIDKSLYIKTRPGYSRHRGNAPAGKPGRILEGHARCRDEQVEGTRGDAFPSPWGRVCDRAYIDKYLSIIKPADAVQATSGSAHDERQAGAGDRSAHSSVACRIRPRERT